MNRKIFIFGGLFALAVGISGYGMLTGTANTGHGGHNSKSNSNHPTEAGQSAFAAIAEIVGLLQANPDTDWSKVNINRLREHLIDMEMLIMTANVAVVEINNGTLFQVSGNGKTLKAIQAMVPAHAKELNRSTDWIVATKLTTTGVDLEVRSDATLERTKIKALGFFGIMATGAHHQPHHLAMANGQAHGH